MAFRVVGEAVAKLRKGRLVGLTQSDVAALCALPQPFLCEIEKGRRGLAAYATRLAPMLGAGVWEILRLETKLRHQLDLLEAAAEKMAGVLVAKAGPDSVVAWSGDASFDKEAVAAELARRAIAFDWQSALTVERLADALGPTAEWPIEEIAVLERVVRRWHSRLQVISS